MRSKDQVQTGRVAGDGPRGRVAVSRRRGRIPNFAGAKLAAQKLAGHRLWKRAKVIKANPDSPQTHARRLALEEGKKLVMAVPRLRDQHPFRAPRSRKRLTKAQVREAATIKGALRHGKVVALEEIPEIDFVLCGSVAVNLSGAPARQGWRLLRPRVRAADRGGQDRRPHLVATTVHPIQILREHLMITDHDLPVDLIATPRAVIEVERVYDAPAAASSGTTSSRRRSTRSRCWSGWGTRSGIRGIRRADEPPGQLLEEFFPFTPPRAELPDPTPAEGPDPTGTRTPSGCGSTGGSTSTAIDVGGGQRT